jgi:hypothetical protein
MSRLRSSSSGNFERRSVSGRNAGIVRLVATFKDVFPHNDAVARFVISMAMAASDIRLALDAVSKITADEEGVKQDPGSNGTTRTRGSESAADAIYFYYVRLLFAHLFAAREAHQAWQDNEDVKAWLGRNENLNQTEWRQAREDVPEWLRSARNATFHYPHPSQHNPNTDQRLQNAIENHWVEDVIFRIRKDKNGELVEISYEFAERIALATALDALNGVSADGMKGQFGDARDAAHEFEAFASRVVERYLKDKEVSLGNG